MTHCKTRGGYLPLALGFVSISLYVPISQASSNDSKVATLSQSPAWHALLHARNGKFYVDDSRFLLSAPNPTVEKELLATLDAFKKAVDAEEEHAICRFPARFLWLRNQGILDEGAYPSINCAEFRHYLGMAPATSVKLVFASENVYSAASMMGHVFFKLEGINKDGNPVEHAVSYFAAMDTLSLPKLYIQALVTGLPGSFALSPYSPQKSRYLVSEGRNIWEYQIKLDPDQMDMFRAHIWELRNITATYFFTSHNCATATYFLLATIEPRVLSLKENWISPIDVVRTAHAFDLIDKSQLFPSSRWEIKMLSDQLGDDHSRSVYAAVSNRELLGTVGTNADVGNQFMLQRVLYRSYISYLAEDHQLSDTSVLTLKRNLELMSEKDAHAYQIDISDYKNPAKGPRDSQWTLASGSQDSDEFVQLRLMAASHRLEDDNRQYFSESGLELGAISWRFSSRHHAPKLHDATLYSMASINPWDRFTGGISSKLRIGIQRQFDTNLDDRLAFDTSASIGLAGMLHRDIVLYSLAGGGYGFDGATHYLFAEPEIGVIVHEIFNMKTLAQLRYSFNQLASAEGYARLDISQAIFLSDNHALFFTGQWLRNTRESRMALAAAFTRYF